MKLAFYYHITLFQTKDGVFKIPSYLGVFIDSLASHVSQLFILMHESSESEYLQCDYVLKSTNIQWINLGLKTPAWHRAIFHKKILKNNLKLIDNCDIILVRSPSPLAPYFNRYLNKTKLCYLIVGDYESGADSMNTKSLRDKMIKYFLKYSNKLFEKQIKNTDIIVNSPALYSKYEYKAKSIFLIKTSTITKNDFYERIDTCIGSEISILYTGSINPLKGLTELVEATAMLVNDQFNVKCIIVGKELSPGNKFEKELIKKSIELNIKERLIFSGFKTVGDELNMVYRKADIYSIPSYHEGFPRTIWEAMANGLPVVASSVGAIPFYLKDNESVKLVPPKNAFAVYEAIKEIIDDSKLRRKLIKNGYQLAIEALQETQMKLLIKILNHL